MAYVKHFNVLGKTVDIRDGDAYSIANTALEQSFYNGCPNLKNVILVGDSYLQGYTPDGTVNGWGYYFLRAISGRNETNHSFYSGGAGFAHASASTGHTFLTLWNSQIYNLTSDERNAVTTVILVGGYNDKDQDTSDIFTAVTTFISAVSDACPNAELYICGSPGLIPVDYRIRQQILRACDSTTGIHTHYIESEYYMVFQTSYFSDDYIHPTQNGYQRIGYALAKKFCTGVDYMNYATLSLDYTSDYQHNVTNFVNVGKSLQIYSYIIIDSDSNGSNVTAGYLPTWFGYYNNYSSAYVVNRQNFQGWSHELTARGGYGYLFGSSEFGRSIYIQTATGDSFKNGAEITVNAQIPIDFIF